MAQAGIRVLTTREFRRMDSLSGELRVVGGSRRRRGVRWPHRRASCLPAQADKSPVVLAGTDAASRADVGGSAETSQAHAASHATDADPAKTRAADSRRAPEPKDVKIRLWFADETARTTNLSSNQIAQNPGLAQQPDREPAPKEDTSSEKNKTAPQPSSSGGNEGNEKAIESLWEERVHLDGGDDLPPDAPGFVDAVNEYVDLVRLADSFLRERDEKSSKSLLEKLLEMKYGKGGKAELGGVRQIICDLPGPVRE